uniref:Uncharacterized protein n=1 Tax=Anguilla anguilla TaxID=7936 RepID=A0A0E9UC65_ANGAN
MSSYFIFVLPIKSIKQR